MSISESTHEPHYSVAEKAMEAVVISESKGQSSIPLAEKETAWKTDDEQVLPKNNLPLVFFSLLLATFLVGSSHSIPALDDRAQITMVRLPLTKQCTPMRG